MTERGYKITRRHAILCVCVSIYKDMQRAGAVERFLSFGIIFKGALGSCQRIRKKKKRKWIGRKVCPLGDGKDYTRDRVHKKKKKRQKPLGYNNNVRKLLLLRFVDR